MGVDDGAAVRLVLIELRVHVPLAGGLALAVYHVGLQVHDDDVFRGGLHVADAGGLDGHEAEFGVIDALVAAGAGAEAGRAHLLADFNDQFAFFLH